ncbi:hypothetical protein [Streptomyces sp. NPDC091273]|uniref:hypothetical protein n=1 Tax=unclassified Streptomyces TaxID=2593676 RepID=UPI00288505AB|nr:hypothetical protein [Streptomyces sp. DSM 41633]
MLGRGSVRPLAGVHQDVPGVVLYEEHLRSGWWLLPRLLGIALICAGVLALARAGDDGL